MPPVFFVETNSLEKNFTAAQPAFKRRVGLSADRKNIPAYPTMKLKTTTACLVALSLGSLITNAQEGERKGPPPGEGGRGGNRLAEFLNRADANKDGKISKEEFGSISRGDGGNERFDRMDTNKDGYVDQEEMKAIGERMREGMRGRPDGEGRRRPDGEGGGFRRPEGGSRPDGEGRRPEGGPPGGPGPNLNEAFGRMDKNNDGHVDKDEFTEFSKQEIENRFNRADENNDGKISKEEMRAGMERMRNMMRGPGGPNSGPGGFGRGPGPDGGPRRGPGGREGGEGGFRRPPNQEGDKKPDAPKTEEKATDKDAA